MESVKWGEHGNIPPHTLNMYAPASWLDTPTKKVVQPVVTAKIGYPVFADRSGVFYHAKNNFDYVLPIKWKNEESESSLSSATNPLFRDYEYFIPTENDVEDTYIQLKGRGLKFVDKNQMAIKYIQQSTNGDIVSNVATGCSLFNRKAGKCYCTAADRANPDAPINKELQFDFDICFHGNGGKPEYPCR